MDIDQTAEVVFVPNELGCTRMCSNTRSTPKCQNLSTQMATFKEGTVPSYINQLSLHSCDEGDCQIAVAELLRRVLAAKML
jgi:hypothetical protein